MLSVKQAKFALRILVPIFIAIFSIFVLANKVPNYKLVDETVQILDDNTSTVMKFSAATMSASLVITMLPDDLGTPLADVIADLNKYLLLVLVAIFLERIIVTAGTQIVFLIVIPMACGLFVISNFVKPEFFESLAKKLFVLGMAIVLVVPCGTFASKYMCASYLETVNETIEETEKSSNTVNDIAAADTSDQSFFDKVSNAFKTAIDGMTGLASYFKEILKKCINSIAILIVTTCLIPLLMLAFFVWLLKQLFNFDIVAKAKTSGTEFKKLISKTEG